MRTVEPHPEWVRILKDYTARNAGRRARLELDDPELGAPWGEVDFPLRGVTYDRRDDRVEIMLGATAILEERLTHSIARPTSIDIVASAPPGGEILRIRHPDGQTLLQLLR